MKITLCLLVLDEKIGCEADVPKLCREYFDDVYAVDGGSTDGTVEYLQAQRIRVFKQPQRSLNAAYAYAVEMCKTEGLVVFFPKGTLNPDCTKAMADKLKEGYDLVVASRFIDGGRNEEDHRVFKPRKWGVKALSFTASLLWRREGWQIRDVLHGVKAFTVSAYRRMDISSKGVTVDLEMTVRSYRLRIPRTELPVFESERLFGETTFPIWKTGKKLGRFLVAEVFRKAPKQASSPQEIHDTSEIPGIPE
jgi:glycosyltransferase involved in cell wall biosynthesis